MFDRTHSRRAILAGAAALPALAIPAIAIATAGMTPIASLWAQRNVALEAKKLACEAQDATWARYKTIKPSLPGDLKLTGLDLVYLPGEPEWVKPLLPKEGLTDHYVIALKHWREIEAQLSARPNADADILAMVRRRLSLSEQYDREDAAAFNASGHADATVTYDDAVVLVYEIEDTIMAAPVTCAGDLAIKAATLERQSKEGLIYPDDLAKLFADVRAFGGMPAVV